MDLSVQGLIDSIKLAGTFPDGMFTDADYVKFLNDGFYSDVLSFVMKHREDYYLTYTDYAYANSIGIPARAIGSKLNDVLKISSDGKTIIGNIPRLTREEMTYNTVAGFYLEGNNVKFYPQDSISDKVRLYFYQRPFPLDEPANIMEILSWTEGTLTAEIDQLPDWVDYPLNCSLTSNDQPYDFYSNRIVGASESLLTIEFNATGPVLSQYVCRENYRAIPDIPLECREVLIQSAILKAMVSLKDNDGVKLASESLKLAKDNSSTILTPRVDNQVKKIVNKRGIWRR